MSCLCGDTACPSCGPAQGHDPVFECIVEEVVASLDSERWGVIGDSIYAIVAEILMVFALEPNTDKVRFELECWAKVRIFLLAKVHFLN